MSTFNTLYLFTLLFLTTSTFTQQKLSYKEVVINYLRQEKNLNVRPENISDTIGIRTAFYQTPQYKQLWAQRDTVGNRFHSKDMRHVTLAQINKNTAMSVAKVKAINKQMDLLQASFKSVVREYLMFVKIKSATPLTDTLKVWLDPKLEKVIGCRNAFEDR